MYLALVSSNLFSFSDSLSPRGESTCICSPELTFSQLKNSVRNKHLFIHDVDP